MVFVLGFGFFGGAVGVGVGLFGEVDDLVQCLPVEFVPSWLVGFKRRGVSRVTLALPNDKSPRQ